MARPTTSYAFGAFVLDAGAYHLLADGRAMSLSPRALDLLFLFAGRPGALVTKDEILAALWPDVAVTDNALTQVVSEIRQALGDSPSTPRFVQTVPRRGYRFVANVRPQTGDVAPAPALRTVVVDDFVNHTRDESLAWLSVGMAASVANGLRVVRDLSVRDRASEAGAPSARPPRGLVVRGGFQRVGTQIRITAEAVEDETGRVVAHAKADGELAQLFALQDAVTAQLADAFDPPRAAREPRVRPRETASLEAYRALTEGRLRLEGLDLAAVPEAVRHFERALEHDPAYALAYVGLAHAELWRFQASRLSSQPNQAALASAIAHARKAVDLDPQLAEAHAALAFLLGTAGRSREAVEAGRVASALEPANWRHQFRLGLAAWGDERLAALAAVVAVYPGLTYAYFAIAMVHVARQDLAEAERVLRAGLAASPGAADARFPGGGLHWLLGLIRLAAGETADAVAEFDRQLAAPPSLLADEFAMNADDARGFVALAAGDWRRAADCFERALGRVTEHARSLVGLAAAARGGRQLEQAAEATGRAHAAIAALRAQGRAVDAAMAVAVEAGLADRGAEALAALGALLEQAPPGSAGWTIPVEPAFAALRADARFTGLLARLAARAR